MTIDEIKAINKKALALKIHPLKCDCGKCWYIYCPECGKPISCEKESSKCE